MRVGSAKYIIEFTVLDPDTPMESYKGLDSVLLSGIREGLKDFPCITMNVKAIREEVNEFTEVYNED